MKLKKTLILLAALCNASVLTLTAAELSAADKQYLSGYEKVRAALTADDLDGAKKAAADLGADGTGIAQSKSLAEARNAFEQASAKAKQLVAGQSGYHIFHCPMLKKDWVQTSTTVANPYGGKAMVSCGEIKK